MFIRIYVYLCVSLILIEDNGVFSKSITQNNILSQSEDVLVPKSNNYPHENIKEHNKRDIDVTTATVVIVNTTQDGNVTKSDIPICAPTTNNTKHSTDEAHDQGHDDKHPSIHIASWNFSHVEKPFIISVFLLIAGIAKLGFHHANFLSSKVPESCLLIILGLIVGAILYGTVPVENDRPGLSSELFFLYLLPPIILESAYSLHDRTFYENVGTVLIYAVLGTVFNCFLIGPSIYWLYNMGAMGSGMVPINLIQCLVFSAIIVAVDPVAVLAIFQEVGVNNTLYFLVFGESLLNDAVTVVLYNMMKTFNLMDHITIDQIILGIVQFFVVSLGGLAIGIIFGALTAIITKFTEHCRVVEPLAVFVLAYLAYIMAEMFHFSGIISIIGCGLTQAQYAFHNISKKSHTTVKYFSKMMSATSDCVIFMFLGISVFKSDVLDINYWHFGFIMWTIFLCLFYRFLVVFGVTFVLNKSNRIRKMDLTEQFIMAYGGLRGAVAFSLVDVLQHKNLPKGHFLTTTLIVIFFTVFIQGSTIKPLVKFLQVKMQQKEKLLLSEEITNHVTDHVMAGIEEILGEKGEHYVREILEYYNQRYLKTWLQRDPISTDEQIMLLFEQLSLEQHFENLAGSKMIMEKYGSDTQLLIDDIMEPDEDESRHSDDVGSSCGNLTFPVPSVNVSMEDISSALDQEILRNQADRRRKSMFPVNISKGMEARLSINPTAEDIRKIMVPSRRQVQYKRLDKNIKSEDSETDLMRYLQNKQMRTRRMSQAVWNQPICEMPEINQERMRQPRKSLVPAEASNNYRRRLSLAPPLAQQNEARRRGVSAGNVLKGLDSPSRRRLRLKRWTSSQSQDGSEDGQKGGNLSPVKEQQSPAKIGFTLDASGETENDPLIALNELSDEEAGGISNKTNGTKLPHGEESTSFSVINDDPKKVKRLSKPEQDSGNSPKERVRSPERTVKFLAPKHSPSAMRRGKFKRSKTLDMEVLKEADESVQESPDQNPESPKMRKNLSYHKAVSFDSF